MKKTAMILLALSVCALLLTGCGPSSPRSQTEALKVYSFHGENDVISVENGVIVSDGQAEICYGGNLDGNQNAFSDIAAYSVTFYLSVDNEREVLMSNSANDHTGGTVNVFGDLGKITGDVIRDSDVEQLPDHLWFELKTTDLSGQEHTYQFPLQVTEITKTTETDSQRPD